MNPNYLSYQSGDIARSLLLFKNCNTTTEDNIKYFKIYTGNVYGLSKLSRVERIKWFDDNIEDILSVFSEVAKFEDRYLKNAKYPAQIVSSILNYIEYKLTGENIRVPILFYATCSGIQHLSALTADIS